MDTTLAIRPFPNPHSPSLLDGATAENLQHAEAAAAPVNTSAAMAVPISGGSAGRRA